MITTEKNTEESILKAIANTTLCQGKYSATSIMIMLHNNNIINFIAIESFDAHSLNS